MEYKISVGDRKQTNKCFLVSLTWLNVDEWLYRRPIQCSNSAKSSAETSVMGRESLYNSGSIWDIVIYGSVLAYVR